jgi:succinate dehydrogenase/fumarate reductase flavoprotein subunit
MVRAIQTDVLVIGGGGAGFRAAIAAKQNGVKVLLASKGPLARCGATPMAGADFTLDGKSLKGFGFPGAADDSREKFFSDIVHQGFFLNNQRLLEQYVRSAPARLKELLAWGLKISRSEERAVYTSGLWIMDVLLRRAKAAGVEFLEDVMILDLVRKDRRVQGAVGLDVKTGEFIRISSRAVVIATGGWHKAFWPTTGMRDLSGEGIVMAHRAGAEIGNMEFVTFCCPVLLSPPHCRGSIATYIMILRAGGRLRNTAGEEFLNKYDPFTVQKGTFMEWNKLFLSLTTAKEVRAGLGSPNGGVFYDRGEMPWEEYEDRVTVSLTGWKYKAIDLSDIAARLREGDSIEVGAVAEYYAAGECTLGPFGANRVCSAITEMLVHGADAGKNAAIFADQSKAAFPEKDAFEAVEHKALLPLRRRDGIEPGPLRRQVQEMAHRHLGPVRIESDLKQFIEFLHKVKKDKLPALAAGLSGAVYNKAWLDALELSDMVHLLECAAKSALLRTESRGVHYREDYPQTDNDGWLVETISVLQDDELQIDTRPVTVTELNPRPGLIPYLDMLKAMMEAHSDVGGHH